MSTGLLFGPEADEDVTAAVIWYHERSPRLEDRFLDELVSALARIKDRPHAFPRISGDIHQVSMARFPYTIVYSWSGNSIEIIRVYHAKRDEARKIPKRFR